MRCTHKVVVLWASVAFVCMPMLWVQAGLMAAGVAPPAAMAAPAVDASTHPSGTLSQALGSLDADEQIFHQHVVTLTNPFFEGRAPGTRGNEITAEYFEWWFRRYKLEPAFPAAVGEGGEAKRANASFRQEFTAGKQPTVKTERVEIVRGQSRGPLTPGVGFTVRGNSGSGKVAGPVVSVGYAVQGGENNYNTFKEGESLAGKVAMVFRFEPLDEKGQSLWTKGQGFSDKASLNAKLRSLMEREPLAVLVVMPPGVDDPRGTMLETTLGTRQGGVQKVPVVNLSLAAAEELAKAGGTTLMDLRKAADAGGGTTELAGVQVEMDVQVARTDVRAENVGGVIRGRGALAEQYVVIGAHMDHLGYGYFGSRAGPSAAGTLHPGADDNASGAAGLLLAARLLSQAYALLPESAEARSVLLLGFNAEEGGLIGSRYYVAHAPITAEQTYVMLNMDMIGRVRNNRLEVAGVGSAEGFAEWLQESWAKSGLTVKTLPGGSGPSDHASFYRVGVPVLHFFTGLHAEYHMPTDLYLTINTPGAVMVVRSVVDVAMRLATRPGALVFKRATGPSIDMSTDKDDPRAAGTPGNDPAVPVAPVPAADPGVMTGGVRVRFGIAPGDYSGEGGGVEVGEVYPNTSAADAGIKQGDRITKRNSTMITSVDDWMPMLASAKPGDEVVLQVKRGQEVLEIKAKLRARSGGE